MGRLLIRKACVLALCATLATGTWARDPFTTQESFKPSDSAEVMAWETSESLAKDNLKRRAVAAQRLPIETYMQGVLDKLYPEFAGKMRVRLMPDVGANAFAMPNGDIYVGGGMLLRMTSEAQLAALLGHEATHVTHRHGIDGFETSTGVVGGATVVNVLISAVPLPVSGLSSLVVNPLMRLATQYGVHFTALSSVAGFSRGRESEADEEGYRRMVAAGYDPKEAVKLFQNLADETKMATRNHESFFFASHPAMVERVSNFERFIKDTPAKQGVVGSEQYEAQVGPMRPAMVERELKRFTMGYIDNGFVAFFERPDVAPCLSRAKLPSTRARLAGGWVTPACRTRQLLLTRPRSRKAGTRRPAMKGWFLSIFGRKRGRRPPRQSRTSWTLAYRRTPRKLLNTRSGSRS